MKVQRFTYSVGATRFPFGAKASATRGLLALSAGIRNRRGVCLTVETKS